MRDLTHEPSENPTMLSLRSVTLGLWAKKEELMRECSYVDRHSAVVLHETVVNISWTSRTGKQRVVLGVHRNVLHGAVGKE